MDFKELKLELLKLDTACLCDASKDNSTPLKVMEPYIKALNPELKLVGKAYTVQTHNDFFTVMSAIENAKEGDVLIIDSQGCNKAVLGEIFASECIRKNLAGIIIDGACRDSQMLKAMNLPIYAKLTNPMVGTNNKIFNKQITINCGGIEINPGDIVMADSDGIIVGTVEEFTSIINKAKDIQEKEKQILTTIQAGESLMDISNFYEHYEKVTQNKESSLGFKNLELKVY